MNASVVRRALSLAPSTSPRLVAVPSAKIAAALAIVVALLVASSWGANASAMPLADPPTTLTPTPGEEPILLRKHDGGCFVTYRSGAVARAACPAVLAAEEVSSFVSKAGDTCTLVFVVGSTYDSRSIPCPSAIVVGFGLEDTPSGVTSAASSGPRPLVDPPMGGLKGSASGNGAAKSASSSSKDDRDRGGDDDKKSGCGGCTTNARSGETGWIAALLASLSAIAARRRGRRIRV